MPVPLTVWLGSERAGTLTAGRRLGQLRFNRLRGGPRLTIAPEGEEYVWRPEFVRAWFENLLPEEERRTAAEREHDVERGDTFGLLAAIGWECAGAVSVLPEDRVPASGSYQALTDDAVLERLDQLPSPVAPVDLKSRMSLGGAQEKLLLSRHDGSWQLPLDGALSTYILKPEPGRFPGLALAEAWALRVASAVTLTAKAEPLIVPGHRPTIVVKRYDRAMVDGLIARTHQEDLCQLLGLMPTEKYPKSEGPRSASLGRLARILISWAADPTLEMARLLEHVTVTVALANTDAHAKNLSVLYSSPGTVSLAPVYDVSPTLFFLPSTRRAALPVGGKWRIDEMELSHLLGEARGWGMPAPVARSVIAHAIERIEAGIADADSAYPETSPEMREVVGRQFERLASSAF